MQNEIIDLYAYYNIKKPKGGAGILTTYVLPKTYDLPSNKIIRPAMLVIPGGGYEFVSKREGEPVALTFVNEGFSAFVLEYSVSPLKYPTQLIEACMAMAFIRENADKYGINKDKVSVIGFSAGGHLCSMLSELFNEPEVKSVLGDKVSLCKPNAIILSYPVICSGEIAHDGSFNALLGKDSELRKRLSIEKLINKNSVPAFIWTTANDDLVPSENSLQLAMAYKKQGVPFELHLFSDGPHGLSICNKELNADYTAVRQWILLCLNWLKNSGFEIIEK